MWGFGPGPAVHLAIVVVWIVWGPFNNTNLTLFIIYGDFRPLPEVVRYPYFEVPYPISNGDNNN